MKLVVSIILLVLTVTHSASGQNFLAGADAYKHKDYATALKHWKPLAMEGDAWAQYEIGWMYYDGQGVIKDSKEAVRWFRRAANQGEARAQSKLGFSYLYGDGVLQDFIMAYVWLNIATANGIEHAASSRDRVAKWLKKSEVNKAHDLSRRCYEKAVSCPEYSF